MKMKKSLRSGYEFTMSKKSALILIQELAKAVNHCEDMSGYGGSFPLRCDLIDNKGEENAVINYFEVLSDANWKQMRGNK